MVHVSDTKGGREPRSYLSGYFFYNSSVQGSSSKIQWRRAHRRARAALGHGRLGGNRQVPPSAATFDYLVPMGVLDLDIRPLLGDVEYLCPSTNGRVSELGI